jgi:chromosome segregation ATPase
MTAALKTAPAPASAARQVLAAAIARKAEVDKQAADAAANAERVGDAVLEQVDVVERARAAVDEVQRAAVAHLADLSTPAPAMTLREAHQALEDAEGKLADLRAARDLAKGAPDALQTSLALAKMRVDEAAAVVIAGEPATRALVERYRRQAAEINSMQRALEFLGNRNALPPELGRWRSFEASNACEASWRAAWAALATDANAALA